MKNIIREMRKRQVFRTAGLYAGGAWILIQVVATILPAFDAEPWVMRALVILALALFPVVVVLSWFFDLMPEGLRQESPDEEERIERAGKISRGRKADFVVIGVLALALAVSVFLNYRAQQAMPQEIPEPMAILIADITNSTDEPLFNGTLEQGLLIGLEESAFITAFSRESATKTAISLGKFSSLTDEAARLVAVREGIAVVIEGRIASKGIGYRLDIKAIEPVSGDIIAEANATPRDKIDVLASVGQLSRRLRAGLGDVGAKRDESDETFTSRSLEAAHDYVQAQKLSLSGDNQAAMALYQSAIDRDKDFGRAWSGLALSAYKLGQQERADEAWRAALGALESMTVRERYRTLGLYYSIVSRNTEKAIENYALLVEQYPADSVGLNNLAVTYFADLQFDLARQMGERVVSIYPSNPLFRANLALFAMYAGDYETAVAQGNRVIELEPTYFKAYLPLAAAALASGDVDLAIAEYNKMALISSGGSSLAATGIADAHLLRKQPKAAIEILGPAISADAENENLRGQANKLMMLAQAMFENGDAHELVGSKIEASLALSRATSQLVPAALLYVEMAQGPKALEIATHLGSQLAPQQRAYAKVIEARQFMAEGKLVDAVDRLGEARDLADLWLVRFALGEAYLALGHHAEAMSEFALCRARGGEMHALFLDDKPSYRINTQLAAAEQRALEGVQQISEAGDGGDIIAAPLP